MARVFYQVQSTRTPGYGHRIWVPRQVLSPKVEQFLNKLSMWGGHDKSDEDALSWEIRDEENLKVTMIFLNCEA